MAKSQTNISQKITKWSIRIWKNAQNYYSSEKWKLEIAVPLSRSPSGHCRSSHLTAIYYLFGFLKKPKGEWRCVFIICVCLSIPLTYLSPKFLFLSHHPSLSLSGFIIPPHHMMRLGSVRVQSQHVASKWLTGNGTQACSPKGQCAGGSSLIRHLQCQAEGFRFFSSEK